jgi:hypothetical protein
MPNQDPGSKLQAPVVPLQDRTRNARVGGGPCGWEFVPGDRWLQFQSEGLAHELSQLPTAGADSTGREAIRSALKARFLMKQPGIHAMPGIVIMVPCASGQAEGENLFARPGGQTAR